MEILSQEIDKTFDLSLLDEYRIIFWEQVTRSQRWQVSGVGVEFPLHFTSNGYDDIIFQKWPHLR